ncbi:MAG: branched-chain amino acid ABC transporter permease [Dongiaceae bacterium]
MDIWIQHGVNALSLGGTYALLALGLAIVWSVVGLVNFAHGDLMTITGYTLYFILAAGLGIEFAVLAAIPVTILAAMTMERVAFRPVRNTNYSTTLLTSFAVSAILQVAFQNLISARPQTIVTPSALTRIVEIAGIQVGMLQITSIGVTIVMLIALSLFIRKSVYGMAMRAAAENFSVTRLMGVRANSVIAVTFALSGLLAGVAAVLWIAQRSSVDPLMGSVPVLKAFIAVVVGGLGRLSGAVVGGFFLAAVEIALRAGLPIEWADYRDAIALFIVIMVLVVRPDGLLGAGRQTVIR